MPEALFTLLFKHQPAAFESGRFVFEAGHSWLVAALALALAAAAAATYLKRRPRLGRRRVTVLAALRSVALAALAFALLRPALRVSTVVPGENFLAVLIDDSRSMRLAGEDGVRRGDAARAAFADPASALRRRLEERFTLRHYRFAGAAERLDPAAPLAFDGRSTDLGAALERARRDLAGVPLAGAVVVSDGADNSGAELADPLLQLASRGIPVYAVGLGDEQFRRDLELLRLAGPGRVLAGSALAVDATVRQRGFDGRTVALTVEEEGAIIATRDVTFARGQVERSLRVQLETEEAGFHTYRFAIAPQEGEEVVENNARDLLLAVDDRREKILYVEGEPRFEVKFLRRAVADDDNLRLVVLQRSAENKYLRLGVDDPLELVAGFPATREERFAYRGLVLGSVEAGFFAAEQLKIVEEFVGQRGGGLLFLGGRRSFAEGRWAGTPLASVLPVVLEEPSAGDFVVQVRVAPTAAGRDHAALQLGVSPVGASPESAPEAAERWQKLPPLSTRNPLYRVKPGAAVLLSGAPVEVAGGGSAGELVVLASQRYGKGRAVAFAVQDSWRWQMGASIAVDDTTHERLWRQLLRWLVSTAPRRVELEAPRRHVAPGEPVVLRAEVRDAGHLGLNGARVSATVTDPAGGERTLPFEWTVERDGEYRATFVPEMLGPYEVRLEAVDGGEIVGSDRLQVVAADLATESFGAEMNAPLLRRIAEETGGRFYTARNLDGLPEDVRFTDSGKTVVESLELWDMPIVLLLVLGAMGAEWALRRRWGLA